MNSSSYITRNNTCAVGPFSPFSEFERELDRLLGGSRSAVATAAVAAPLDVREDADQFTLSLDLPGIRREDIQISFEDGVLTVGAERKAETEVNAQEYLRRERYVGRYERRLTVRTSVAPDGIKATYRDGVLTLVLPKLEAAKPKVIQVSE